MLTISTAFRMLNVIVFVICMLLYTSAGEYNVLAA